MDNNVRTSLQHNDGNIATPWFSFYFTIFKNYDILSYLVTKLATYCAVLLMEAEIWDHSCMVDWAKLNFSLNIGTFSRNFCRYIKFKNHNRFNIYIFLILSMQIGLFPMYLSDIEETW